MNLYQMRRKLWLDLGDYSEVQWSATELNRSIERAVDDLNLIMPREGIKDITCEFEVEGEAWEADLGAAVSLANQWIKWASEMVEDSAGTVCVRDTDYTMDYANGTITALSTSSIITDTEDCTISYTKSKIALDLSSVTNLMRVREVESPYGQVPQYKVASHVWNDWLILDTKMGGMDASKSQGELSEGDHAWVYYAYAHTPPTESADGTYGTYLDETILKGASAYGLFMIADKQDHVAETNLESASTALGNIAAQVTLIGTALTAAQTPLSAMATALAKVDTHVAGASSSTKAALDDVHTITDPSGEVEQDLDAVDGSATAPFEEAASLLTTVEPDQAIWTDWLHRIEGDASLIKGADWHIQNAQGEGKINAVNTGQDVARLYAEYAAGSLAIAQEWRAKVAQLVAQAGARVQTGTLRIQQAQTRINQANALAGEAAGRTAIAQAFLAEAAQRANAAAGYHSEADRRIGILNGYLNEATQYFSLAERYLGLGQRYREEAWLKLAEFKYELNDRGQRLMQRTRSAARQHA